MSDRQEGFKELLGKDPQFAEFFDRFKRSFYNPDDTYDHYLMSGLGSDEVSFDPDQFYKQFRYADDNDVALDKATLLDCLLVSESFRERLQREHEWAREFKDHLARSFNGAIEQLKISQYVSQPSQPTRNWKERLEGKVSFTFVETAEIAGESERSLRNKVNRPDRPGPLIVNSQGRITQESLKTYLLAERKV